MSFSFALVADVQHADKVHVCQEYASLLSDTVQTLTT